MVDNYRKRQAILCGVSQYSKSMGGPLPSIAQEIPLIADALSSKLHQGYCYEVTPLSNQEVALNNLPSIFFPYKQNSSIDELLLYFAGHGTIYKGEPYFVTYGAESNNPGIKLSDLAIEINSLHSGIKQIFLILNFCYSGSFLQPSNLETINQIFSQRTAILTATRNDQLGKTKNQDGKSFANYFVEALTNSLPDKNGHISFGKLALYVSEQMQSSYTQSPVFYAPALSGHPINKVNKKILLPHPRNRFFTGRVEALSSIDAALSNNNSAVITQAQAISGMGGIGKTQTALEFCYRQIYNNSYQTILWVNAETEASFNNSYYDIVDLLNPNSSNEALKVDEVTLNVKRWLANNPNWLMVLDNLENPKLIKDYLPANHQGHVLITTRSQSLKGQAAIIQLKKMGTETGTLFLLKRASLIPTYANDLEQLKADNKIDDVLITDAQNIVQAMDGLPLALEQAGAFIQESKCSLADYLKAYQDVRNSPRILDNDGEDPNDHISVYATFKLNFDVVKEKSIAAAKLLEVCSFLDSDLIPEEIFTQAGNFLGDELGKLQDNTYEFNNCIKLLLGYSLIERDTNKQSLSIHRLVQTVIRDLLTEDNKKLLVDSLTKALWSLSHDDAQDPNTWPYHQRLLPSVTSLFDFAKLYQSNAVEAAYLFHQFGLYCYTQAFFTQSSTFYNLALDIKKHLFGDNNPDIALTLNGMATVCQNQSNYTEALNLYFESLNIYDSFSDYPNLAMVLTNIGTLYRLLGQYENSLKCFLNALNIKLKLFGDNHIEVAIVYTNMGIVYRNLKNLSDALECYKIAYPIYHQSYGNNHPDFALLLYNMGIVYRNLENPSEALECYNKALDIYIRCFGDNHPNVATVLDAIGTVHYYQNNDQEALSYYLKALEICKSYPLDDTKLKLISLLNNIASVYASKNDYSQALNHYMESIAISKPLLGDNHPIVIQTSENIKSLLINRLTPSDLSD